MRQWVIDHVILAWVIASVFLALIVHVLFHIDGTGTFWEARWGAGDIITYTCTTGLGLLTVWQNRKIKEENDKAQERLERLSEQANTLSAISKIIEIENDNLSRLRKALDDFSSACDPTEILSKLSITLTGDNQKVRATSAMAEQEKRIDDSFFALARETRKDPTMYNDSTSPYAKAMGSYYIAAKEMVGGLRKNPFHNPSSEVEVLNLMKIAFLQEREKLLMRKENMLNKTLYGNLSLEEIKKMYHEEYSNTEDTHNG